MEFQSDGREAELTLHRGVTQAASLSSGLIVHSTDVIATRDSDVEILMPEGISFAFILSGSISISFGGCEHEIGPRSGYHGAPVPEGVYSCLKRREVIRRRAKEGTSIRCAEIIIPDHWLEKMGLGTAAAGFDRQHFASGRWPLTPRQAKIAELILEPIHYEPALQNLFLESRAFEAIAEAICTLNTTSFEAGDYSLRRRERSRMSEVKELLDESDSKKLSLEQIADHAGMNLNTLQKQFRAAYGATIYEYVREQRLAKAREALEELGVTVKEAAFLAGFVSSASFSSAFKRRFGFSPSEYRSR